MTHRRRLVLALTALALAACEGPAGPTGPTGPQGPAGPAGPPGAVNRADFKGVVGSSGAATAALPAGAVAGGRLPAIACYISSDGSAWLAVAQTPSADGWPYCGLAGMAAGTPSIVLLHVPAGYLYDLIAVW